MNFLERKNNSSLYQRAALAYVMATHSQDVQQAFDFADGFLNEYTKRTSSPLDAKANKRYVKWTQEEESEMVEMFQSGKQTMEIAKKLSRSYSAIQSRLIKLKLIENPYANR